MADKDFISKVFQQATEEFDMEFNPDAWARMEQKLDRARRRRVLFYWMWGSIATGRAAMAKSGVKRSCTSGYQARYSHRGSSGIARRALYRAGNNCKSNAGCKK